MRWRWLMPVNPAQQEAEVGKLQSKASLCKKRKTLSEKIECLPSKCKALGSNPRTATTKNKNKNKNKKTPRKTKKAWRERVSCSWLQ
jgi:hypothetical protein